MNRYKAIGFDWGGVIGGAQSGKRFIARMCRILEIDEKAYRQAYFARNELINTGKVSTWREFWKIFLKDIGQLDKLDAVMVASDITSQEIIIVDEEMLKLVDRLKAAGYKVGLLSNNTIEKGRELREMGIDKHFDVFHISAEQKLMKPDPKAFKLFAGELGVDTEELIFIDDSEKSLSTADQCGFTPILFTTYEQLVKRLTTLRVL